MIRKEATQNTIFYNSFYINLKPDKTKWRQDGNYHYGIENVYSLRWVVCCMDIVFHFLTWDIVI